MAERRAPCDLHRVIPSRWRPRTDRAPEAQPGIFCVPNHIPAHVLAAYDPAAASAAPSSA